MPDSIGRIISRRSILKLGPGAAGSAIPADPIGLGIDASSLLGILMPLTLDLFSRRSAGAPARLQSGVTLATVLILLGGAPLRISLVAAGQAKVDRLTS